MVEIERKWLLDSLPEFCKYHTKHNIEQCYVSFNPEVRIRKSDSHRIPYRMTIKSNGDLSRIEIEQDIEKEFYESLIKEFINPLGIIEKEFYKVPIEGTDLHYEISLVDKLWSYVEVEFGSEDLAKDFNPPSWFGKEITEFESCKMKNYALTKIGNGGVYKLDSF